MKAFTLTYVKIAIACLLLSLCMRKAATGQSPSTGESAANVEAEFDVVSVRPSSATGQLHFDPTPDGYSARHTPLLWLIFEAFAPEPESFWRENQLRNAPGWISKDPYDIEARVDERTATSFKTMNDEERMRILRPMLRNFLEKRCGLVLHLEESNGNAFALVTNGRKLEMTPAFKDEKSATVGISVGGGGVMSPSTDSDGRKQLLFRHITMTKFAEVLSGLGDFSDTPIIDRTGVIGTYDFVLKKMDDLTASESRNAEPLPPTRWDVGALGLALSKTNIKRPLLVVDKVSRPTEN